ncbi:MULTISPECIES: DUF4224 domain-containing protein [unclassified Pseudomonas]|uniref:DUF4224 domain-containing protein n=1 Tax=unclassified Pseudomonas TaxID=196821 RepID=UPI0025FB1A2F|nr:MULTISPECIES: DUF4224 domain-containing protein [unclassified Pseudomonas]
MSIEFLSHEDVCQLTGARSKAAQIMNLKRNGIRHTVKVNGWPSVTTMAVTASGPASEPTAWQPKKAG